MTVMFQERIGTRFMISSIKSLMQKLLLEIAKTDIIDIAHVNFTPEAMETFMATLPSIKDKVIDSFNSSRNEILQENFRRLENRDKLDVEDMSLPSLKPRSMDELKDYVKQLERGHTYKIASYSTQAFDIPFTVFLQLTKPSVNVILGDYAKSIFKYVSDNLYFNNRRAVINSTDDYLILYPKGDSIHFCVREITILEKDVNKEFNVYPIGEITWTKLIDQIEDYFIIPAHFGKVAVLKDERYKDIYAGVYERSMRDITLYAKSNWKTLQSFLL